MKKTLLVGTTALMTLLNVSAADYGCSETTVCDEEKLDLTGAWLGAGALVDFDKYDADVSVAAEYADLQDTVRTCKIAADATGDMDADGLASVLAFMQKTDAATEDIQAAGAVNFIKANDQPGEAAVSRVQPYTYYAHRNLKMKKTKTVAGGELKGSLFYNVDNGLVFGVDLSLGLTAKAKKTIDVNGVFNSLDNVINAKVVDDVLYVGGDGVAADHINAGRNVSAVAVGTAQAGLAKDRVLANYSYARTGVVAANAGASVSDAAGHSFVYNRDTAGANQAIADAVDGKLASAEFEKDIFSPTLAFVVGGYFKGFFGGLRFGMNYMTGKIHNLKSIHGAVAEDVNHKIRHVSPVVGVQLMKHIKKGVFAYLTYDHMFGINKTFLNSPIKKFKRRQNRVSLGLGYQFKANH